MSKTISAPKTYYFKIMYIILKAWIEQFTKKNIEDYKAYIVQSCKDMQLK